MTRTAHNTGFAMIAALSLLSLAAITLTLLGTAIVNQSRRTQSLAEDAQLRQLLIAGARIAQMENFPGRSTISVPGVSAQLTVQINFPDRSQKTAQIEAELPHHRLFEKAGFTRQNEAWRLQSAQLTP